jgi:hypothetical protein
MATTKLGTQLTFKVIDLRGINGFPQGKKGLAFFHKDFRVRTDPKGWRIDRHCFGLVEAVTVKGKSYFASAEKAAAALASVI